jgi:hypothetical protein
VSSFLESIGFPGARTIEQNVAAPVRSLGSGITPGLTNLRNQLRSLKRSAQAQMDPQEAWLQEGQRQARLRSTPAGPTRDIYEQPGVGYFDRSSGRFLGRGSSSGIQGADIGGDGRGEQYRQQLSQYAPKAFPMTAEGQQERYFGTPEMNYVFGAQTGKGPKTAEEMSALASQEKAPTTSSLSDYYRAQSAMGRVNQADIQAMYADRPDLQKWAAANPMLAQREFIKQQGGPTMAPDGQTVMGDLGSRAQSEGGYTMEAFNPTGFSGAANAVPAPWNTQGQAVSAPYTEAMSKAFDKTNPMNLVSQQPIEMDNDLGVRIQNFLKRGAQ